MSATVEPPDGARSSGPLDLLEPFVEAGVLEPFEVQLATTVLRLEPDTSGGALLALALAARAPRAGHVCIELDQVADRLVVGEGEEQPGPVLPWPTAGEWDRILAGSPIVHRPGEPAGPRLLPLVWDGRRVYLQRYWRYEVEVARALAARSALGSDARSVTDAAGRAPIDRALDRLFGPEGGGEPDRQRLAAFRALSLPVSIIAGGPGTGKTHTIARILVASHQVAADLGRPLRVALVAPTGKAAARMGDAVRAQVAAMSADGMIDPGLADALSAVEPSTIHRLLGRRDRTHFRHDRTALLPHDLVIVDETSMVSLPLLAKLLDVVRPDARLVLVGDPFQLTSVEVGTVMADLVGPIGAPGDPDGPIGAPGDPDGGPGAPTSAATREVGDPDGSAAEQVPVALSPLAGRVTELRLGHRFDAASPIAVLARSIRTGDADGAIDLLAGAPTGVRWVRPDDTAGLDGLRRLVATAAVDVAESASVGDAVAALAAATRVKVLAATRRGPLGVYDWSDRIRAAVDSQLPVGRRGGRVPVGMPLMVTGNDALNRLFNGDVGVVVRRGELKSVALAVGPGVRWLSLAALGEIEPWWAMTIHKSQGSEFPHAVVSLPPAGSAILTRELLYTAVTRAVSEVTVVGGEEAIRTAIARPVTRASGLRQRLWPE